METLAVITAFYTQRAGGTDIPWLHEPDTCQGHLRLTGQPIDYQLEHLLDTTLLCHIEQQTFEQINV